MGGFKSVNTETWDISTKGVMVPKYLWHHMINCFLPISSFYIILYLYPAFRQRISRVLHLFSDATSLSTRLLRSQGQTNVGCNNRGPDSNDGFCIISFPEEVGPQQPGTWKTSSSSVSITQRVATNWWKKSLVSGIDGQGKPFCGEMDAAYYISLLSFTSRRIMYLSGLAKWIGRHNACMICIVLWSSQVSKSEFSNCQLCMDHKDA